MRLSEATFRQLQPGVRRPAYDRSDQAVGIVHFGIGAFHRAHQATYTDAAMSAGDRDFGVAGVSLRSTAVRDQLVPQDCLYTVSELRNGSARVQLIGAVREVFVATPDTSRISEQIADPGVALVTFTITEKGYHRNSAGHLDLCAPQVAADLSGAAPSTIYGFLQRGLGRRMASRGSGITLLSCDNLSDNGRALQHSLLTFLSQADPQLARWVEAECTFPSSMVDRIVPATTEDQLDRLERELGLRDEAAVFTESFSQWAIEDQFAGRRPRWEVGGAEIVPDVREHEAAKLRMLNGAHSALAYLGLEAGHEFVHEAIADPTIAPVIRAIVFDEAAGTLSSAIDTNAYGERLLARFQNGALEHRLQQIAMDGSQKIPQRWLTTFTYQQERGRSCPALLQALASWIRYVRGDRFAVDDPMASKLAELWISAGETGIVRALFGHRGVFKDTWSPTEQEISQLTSAVMRRNAEIAS